MKKAFLLLFLMAFAMIGFSCGESEADLLAREQARIDSLRVAEQASLEARMQAVQDSLAAVEAAQLAEEATKTAYTFDENGIYVLQTGAWRSEVKANLIADRWSRRVSAAYVVQSGDASVGRVKAAMKLVAMFGFEFVLVTSQLCKTPKTLAMKWV